jgi:hypothetical protein
MSENAPALVWDPGKYEFHRKLGNFVQYFQADLPTNKHGVPLKLINPVAMAEHILNCNTIDDVPNHVVENAIVEVEFEDGMPMVDGLPIWERLDGEIMDYYKLFKEYREMLYVHGSRALSRLAETHNILGRNLSALSKVYHWQLRCKAYDAYKKMIYMRKRQFEIEKMETKHAKVAERLLQQSLEYLEQHPEQLNPKIALQMIQIAMRAERLALGLNPDKPGAGEAAPSINIHQTTSTGGNGEATARIEIGPSSSSGQATNNGQPDLSYLQSIVHILDKSGALDQAKKEVIDAEFEEVNDDADTPDAVEGA